MQNTEYATKILRKSKVGTIRFCNQKLYIKKKSYRPNPNPGSMQNKHVKLHRLKVAGANCKILHESQKAHGLHSPNMQPKKTRPKKNGEPKSSPVHWDQKKHLNLRFQIQTAKKSLYLQESQAPDHAPKLNLPLVLQLYHQCRNLHRILHKIPPFVMPN
jgi:hypothetical protein